MTPRRAALLAAAFALVAATAAHAAQIELRTAWMRPAVAGSDAAAYVDIVSDTALTLVGATSPVARRVDIVMVERPDGEDPGRAVRSLPVTAGTPTRLAYKGNHLRLRGLKEDVLNGRPVPVTLAFRDARGRRYRARTDVQVRGLLAPRMMGRGDGGPTSSGRGDGGPTGSGMGAPTGRGDGASQPPADASLSPGAAPPAVPPPH